MKQKSYFKINPLPTLFNKGLRSHSLNNRCSLYKNQLPGIKYKQYHLTNNHDTKNNHPRTSLSPHSQKPLPHPPQRRLPQIQRHRPHRLGTRPPPVFTPQISQVSFTNGINIIAQSNAITFIESLSAKPLENTKIPAVIRKYVEALPRTDYQTLSINPRSFVTFEGEDENAASEYITSTLLSKGTWSDVGKAPVKAAVNLVYALERGELKLSVAEALLQLQDAEPTPAVLFSGSFQYEIAGELEGEKLQHLYKLLDNWQPDLEAYREIVNKRFLGQEVEKLPSAA